MNSSKHKLILIGASTGGPSHIEKILSSLELDFNASVVVAQHMDEVYLKSFAALLNEKSKLDVVLVNEDIEILPKTVYICSKNCILKIESSRVIICQKPSQKNRYNPDIDMLFSSSSKITKQVQILGVILTGIGNDGAKGCLSLVKSGGECLAESEKSAVVFGMPKRAKELSSEIKVKELDEIVQEIKKFGE